MVDKAKYAMLEGFVSKNAERLLGKDFSKVKSETHFKRLLSQFVKEEEQRLEQKGDVKASEKTEGLRRYVKKKGWTNTNSSIRKDIENIEIIKEQAKEEKKKDKESKRSSSQEIKEWEEGILKAETAKLGEKKAKQRYSIRQKAYEQYGTELYRLTRKELRAWDFTETQIKHIKKKKVKKK